METKWLEDFLSVAETLNISRSAKLRNVTQPAFSRRIRALENWLGAELFDRGSYPTRLTPAGKLFQTQAKDMLDRTFYLRSMLRGQMIDSQTLMSFAMPHTLSLTYFPKWLSEVEQYSGTMSVRLLATNVHDAVMALTDGNCDLLMCYYHAYQALELDSKRYAMVSVGTESLRPYTKADDAGLPIFRLPGTAAKPLPFLCYSPDTSLGRVVERILNESPEPVHLFRRAETDLAEGLKMMTLRGHGVAWLPGSSVAKEVASGELVLAVDPSRVGPGPLADTWSGEMDVRIYRDRERQRPVLKRLWDHLAREFPQPD